MRTVSVMVYTAARCAPFLSWPPIWVTFLLIISIGYVSGAPAADSLDVGAALLVPVSTWMAMATFRGEDPVQSGTHALHYGSRAGYRFMLSVTSFVASIAVLPLSLGYAWLRAPSAPDTPMVIMALLTQFVAAATGTAIGSWLTRPFVERQSTAFVLGLGISVGLVAVPRIPPVRLLTDVITVTPGGGHLLQTVAVLIITLVAAGSACWAAGDRAPRRV
jgi:hypothetical protein